MSTRKTIGYEEVLQLRKWDPRKRNRQAYLNLSWLNSQDKSRKNKKIRRCLLSIVEKCAGVKVPSCGLTQVVDDVAFQDALAYVL